MASKTGSVSPKRDTTLYKCTCCGVKYKTQKGNFLMSGSPLFAGNNGYVTICRSCTDNLYNRVLGEFNGDAEKAIDYICGIFDLYFNEEVVASTKDIVAPNTRISVYPSRLNMAQYSKHRGKTYLDTIKERFDRPKIENDEVIGESLDPQDDLSDISPETIKFFGSGLTADDYRYLQEQYNDWTTRYTCETKAQELMFKKICLAQLADEEAHRKRDPKEIEKTTRILQSLLTDLNITPRQDSANLASGQDTFGTLIKKLENERPVSEPQEQWKDVDGIHKYIDTWFFGRLCELVDIQNPNENKYQEEVAKYSIAPPQQDDLFGETETSLLDRLAKRRNEGDDNLGNNTE